MAILPGRHEHRTPDYPIETLFIDRWSPRSMSGEPLAAAELMRLFEAARWALVNVQRTGVAVPLCPPRHAALAELLRIADGGEPGLVPRASVLMVVLRTKSSRKWESESGPHF